MHIILFFSTLIEYLKKGKATPRKKIIFEEILKTKANNKNETAIIYIYVFVYAIGAFAQVGINTTTPNPSAIVDLTSSNKAFKGPEVALTNIYDEATIPNPVRGLVVYNTANSGITPNNVEANNYYYWNGTEWYFIPTTRIIEEIVTPGVFVVNSTHNQTINNINSGNHQLVQFPSSATETTNVGNIASLSNNFITIQETGLYEVSAFVNYNPNQNTDERRIMLNTYIEKNVSGSWQPIAGGRTAWGRNTTNYLQTAMIPLTCVQLNEGDIIRLSIANKITSGTRSLHGNTSTIQTNTNAPWSKSLRLYLISYDD